MFRKLAVLLALTGVLSVLSLARAPQAQAAWNLSLTNELQIRNKVIAYALQQVREREPYCYGGTGPSCFDCSGLVYAAYRYAGRTLPVRTSTQMRRWTLATSRTLRYARGGDLLFYSGHVEIFYKRGYAISATHTGGPPVNIHRIRTSGLLKVGKVVY